MQTDSIINLASIPQPAKAQQVQAYPNASGDRDFRKDLDKAAGELRQSEKQDKPKFEEKISTNNNGDKYEKAGKAKQTNDENTESVNSNAASQTNQENASNQNVENHGQQAVDGSSAVTSQAVPSEEARNIVEQLGSGDKKTGNELALDVLMQLVAAGVPVAPKAQEAVAAGGNGNSSPVASPIIAAQDISLVPEIIEPVETATTPMDAAKPEAQTASPASVAGNNMFREILESIPAHAEKAGMVLPAEMAGKVNAPDLSSAVVSTEVAVQQKINGTDLKTPEIQVNANAVNTEASKQVVAVNVQPVMPQVQQQNSAPEAQQKMAENPAVIVDAANTPKPSQIVLEQAAEKIIRDIKSTGLGEVVDSSSAVDKFKLQLKAVEVNGAGTTAVEVANEGTGGDVKKPATENVVAATGQKVSGEAGRTIDGSATSQFASVMAGQDGSSINGTATEQLSDNSDSAKALQTTHKHAQVLDQVLVKVQDVAKDGSQKITVRLDPPELGRVDVKIDFAPDGKATLSISADSRATLDILQKHSRELERGLLDAGIKADSGSLSFNMNGQNQNGYQAYQDDFSWKGNPYARYTTDDEQGVNGMNPAIAAKIYSITPDSVNILV